LDFWNNLSVNLLSNLIWVILVFAAAQFVKRAFAKSALSSAPPSPSIDLIIHEHWLDTLRRVVRATFAFGGLLIVVLMICTTFAGSTQAWQHALGWLAVLLAWLVWHWSVRDPRLAGKVYRGPRAAWMRYTLALAVASFWLALLGGLVLVIYDI